jgi:tRNA-dihydrouridine synthase B
MTLDSNTNIFSRLGLPSRPVILAPLAGVSDHPFRRICTLHGADLTYVEMISATAMLFKSQRTYDMLKRHSSEKVLGVQITGRTAEEVSEAVQILDGMPFDTIDINMGCPVNKVVRAGCGSGILKDPERVYQTVKLCRSATAKPLSAKFRLGWDLQSMNWQENASAIQSAGADWMTIHGRLRSDDYGVPVRLEEMAKLRKIVQIPLIGNGNIFCHEDDELMTAASAVDGIMVSRGALGNPWVFNELKNKGLKVSLDSWVETVLTHLSWQQEEYGDTGYGAVCMRKHLLWYAKGWPEAKKLREAISQLGRISEAKELIHQFAEQWAQQGHQFRIESASLSHGSRFQWDPKYEMDRSLDRGIGDDCLEANLLDLASQS